MIKNFQLLIHQVLDNIELNEKTFRDCGSGFIIGLNLLEEKGYCHAKYNDINSFA